MGDTATEPVLEVHEIVKRYKSVTAVSGLSFSLRRGEIFALLGPNGAGKTTTVRMLAGIYGKEPTWGEMLRALRNA